MQDLLSLTDVTKTIPKRVHTSCVWCWMRVGCKSRSGVRIHLRHYRVGGRLYTSAKDLEEFFAKLAEADLEYFNQHSAQVDPACKSVRTPEQRQLAVEQASKKLEAAGF